ncbi:hypothetical protein [Alteribacillus bidgolensis]|uniref:Uncharacterized protein n=1 Tax=Alteribacillus bidgolensis TaxID=930129 RepID=A0A1G8L9E3_9BACI|nr:hypothetical protein [Alteribacillus bidgolensis]SDI52309.1 hypothetical protein SAMN05216352_108209 [Alteribacillus bidgolensis]
MTVSQKKSIVSIEKQIEELNTKLNNLKHKSEEKFEQLETDDFILEVYN